MVAKIDVKALGADAFRVTVTDAEGETTHQVTAELAYCQGLTGGAIPAAELVRRSFEFLLDREPKESILRRFALPVIGRYFPEYEREMKRRAGA